MKDNSGTRNAQPSGTVRMCEDVSVIDEADICVLGGSCTGVFAAVRAARLGARVTIVEKSSHFGGMAGLVCTWHSLMDTLFQKQIIAGLTQETVERLQKRDAVNIIRGNAVVGCIFRPGEMKIVLDELVVENGIRPWLHTLFTAPVVENGRLTGVVVENKSGRGVVRAKMFVDATGDGDLCARLGLRQYRYDAMLPPTTCAFLDQWPSKQEFDLGDVIRRHGREYGLKSGFVCGSNLPGTDIFMLNGTRVYGADCSDANALTLAEIEGRRQIGAIMELLRGNLPASGVRLHDFPATIGIRDTRHITCQYQLTGEDVLKGRRFPDAIANGSYRVDTHHQDKPGITCMYLDGRIVYEQPGYPHEWGRWREAADIDPTFYQVPLRSLIPGACDNLILAGRSLDADKTAFSAVRVMVNANQMGEAAGVAAFIALSAGIPISRVEFDDVRSKLSRGGSVVI